MAPAPRRVPAVPAVLALLLLAVLAPAAPAAAHQADPRIVTTVDVVEPALPDAVVLQVQANVATQLVAANPTPTVLEVLGTDDRPFLRISSAGVFADVVSEDFLTTSNPNGAAPRSSDGPARWAQISAGDSWGWYDHRLHPAELVAPADEGRTSRLAQFEVPVRYGTQRSVVRGTVTFQPLLGTFSVAAGPAPAGLVVQALPGRLPGVFLSNPERTPLTVLGRDGEPFLRFGPLGVEVNERSRTHVEDRQARGIAAGPPSTQPAFRLVAPGGTSYTWLDTRLRYPQELPPPSVLSAGEPTVVTRWQVPVQGAPALTGTVSWVPERSAAGLAQSRRPEPAGRAVLPYALVAGAVLALVGAVVVLRRRRA